MSICWSVGWFVGLSIDVWVGPWYFCKNCKIYWKIILFLQFYASIHSLVCLSTYLSIFPLFCPFDWPSIHTYICNHIVKIAKSIAKLSKSNGNQWYYSMERHNINRRKKNIKKKKIALKSCIVVCTNLFSLPFILLLMPWTKWLMVLICPLVISYHLQTIITIKL